MLERFNIDESKESEIAGLIEVIQEKNKVFQRTWELEADVENDQATEQSKKEVLANGLYDQLKRRGKQALEIVTFMTALGLAGCYKADSAPIEKPQTSENSEVQKKNELITDQQNEMILRETGIDLKSVAEKMGFEVEFEIPSTTGKYILHIGQTHYIKEADDNPKIINEIIASQMAIEKGLLALAEKGEKDVFVEAITIEGQKGRAIDIGGHAHAEADGVRPTKKCFDELISMYDLNRDIFKGMTEDDRRAGKFDSEHEKIRDYLITMRGNIYTRRAEELRKELESMGEFDQKTQESFDKAIKSFKPYGWYAAHDGKVQYIEGAAQKLETEGIIKVLPAETREGNEGAFKYKDDMKKVSDAYFNFDFQNKALEEIKAVRKEYEQVKGLNDKNILDIREEIAVSLIKQNESSHEDKIAVIVFGSAHDFRKMLEASNKANPESQMGLIKFISRKPVSSIDSVIHP